MKRLFCLILMGVLTAQDLPTGRSQHPKIKKHFNISYQDLHHIDTTEFTGNVLVEFTVNENGKVVKPNIIDTFNIEFEKLITNVAEKN